MHPAVLSRRLSQIRAGIRLPTVRACRRCSGPVSVSSVARATSGAGTATRSPRPTPVSGAARRLEQKNRLAVLTDEAAEAEGQASAAREAHETWAKRLSDLKRGPTVRRATRGVRPRRTSPQPAGPRPARRPERATLDARLDTLRDAARRHAEQVEAAIAEVAEAEETKASARGSGDRARKARRHAHDRGCRAHTR